ncbi:MAG: geranylgeranylglyceryl/heptaprenylglyceryl phosphate synthase [Flavobacteriia bacterium]|nr:geranylgeranylglyceryl/heptaprenylglyceryl phosphate synthase [Flavobacteriia bacterium]
MKADILTKISEIKNAVAILIDPEKFSTLPHLSSFLEKINAAKPNFIFIGGSTVTRKDFNQCIKEIKAKTAIPIVIFPGASHQISKEADAILFLSLLSGRNPDYLIGHHVQAVDELEKMDIEIIPTAYLLIDGGRKSAVEYVTQTSPIPSDQPNIVRKTALAGKFQGKKIIYLDAGSGAIHSIPTEIIKSVNNLEMPLIVGGGITSIEEVSLAHKAGANIVVIGNKIEKDIDFLLDIANYNKAINIVK